MSGEAQWNSDQAIGERALREDAERCRKCRAGKSMTDGNVMGASSVEGYRRDIDNCLAELQHKNRVLRDRDIEYGRVCFERDQAMTAAQIGVAQCAQVQDALRRVLPMAEAWFRHEFDGLCDHEPGKCACDREAHARTDINIALVALGKRRQ